MTQAEKAELKTVIEQKIAKTENDRPVAPDVAIGRISRMDAINNKSVMEASSRRPKINYNL